MPVLTAGVLLLYYLAAPAFGAEATAGIAVLPAVTVIGTLDVEATGKSTIGREVIASFPRGNGSINELLNVLPDVRLKDAAKTSRTGGEILPPDVSISGGKGFQNHFTIDGIGNDSVLDPASRNPNDLNDTPGHAQEVFLDSSLVEEVTVFDSNVPARYGDFTGGVVEATTRDPGPEFKGQIYLRTTRDEWTTFHVDGEDRFEFENSSSADRQPRFEKYHAGASLEIPMGGDMGVLPSYQILHSTIPLSHLGGFRKQSRQLENYFLKYAWTPTDRDSLAISILYAPYRGEYFLQDTKNSDFRIDGSGQVAGARYTRLLEAGELELKASFRRSENSRTAPTNWRLWAATDTKDWGRSVGSDFSREGGFGDIGKTQESVGLHAGLTLNGFAAGGTTHEPALGLEVERIRGTFVRKDTSFVYRQPKIAPDVLCGDDLFACVEQEQFFTLRNVYGAATAEAALNRFALYSDDLIRLRRLELTPGLRLSYDDFLKNLNLAPRLAATYDLFANGQTILVAGLNRYYGKALLTFKLREAIAPHRTETRTTYQNRLTDWEPSPFQGSSVTRFSPLDTPYSDEAVFGLDQSLAGGRLSAKYVHREGRDEFTKEFGPLQPDGLRYFTLSNNGSSRHRSFRISWERVWPAHYLSINAVYRKSDTSNEDYDDILELDGGEERVWFRGAVVYKGELPDEAYELPWEVKLTYTARLPYGLTFTNFTRYISAYENLENTFEEKSIPEGERRIDPLTGEEIFEALDVFEVVKHSDLLLFDWKFGWQAALFRNRHLALNLEVLNVFNSKVPAGSAKEGFLLGRQFWVGLEYLF